MQEPKSPLPYASVPQPSSRRWLLWVVLGIAAVVVVLGAVFFAVMTYLVAAPATKTVVAPPVVAPRMQSTTMPSTAPAP